MKNRNAKQKMQNNNENKQAGAELGQAQLRLSQLLISWQ